MKNSASELASNARFLYIFMGVSGCGKSTLAKTFSQNHDIEFIDAYDFHSQEIKQHMQNGNPLTDEMCKPWVASLISELQHKKVSVALAFSGLKAEQRRSFLALNSRVIFFHLTIPISEAKYRLSERKNHFFQANLIQSQYDSMEAAQTGEEIIELDATESVNNIIKKVENILDEMPTFVPVTKLNEILSDNKQH